jgi:hypothetical protein
MEVAAYADVAQESRADDAPPAPGDGRRGRVDAPLVLLLGRAQEREALSVGDHLRPGSCLSLNTHGPFVSMWRGARYNAGVEGVAQLLDKQGSVDMD